MIKRNLYFVLILVIHHLKYFYESENKIFLTDIYQNWKLGHILRNVLSAVRIVTRKAGMVLLILNVNVSRSQGR